MSLLRLALCLFAISLPLGAQGETIQLGAEDSWYPYSGSINGNAKGFTVDLVRAAFAAVNVTVEFQPLPYARCMTLVKQGTLLGCFNTARAAIVEDTYLWHKRPMFSSRSMIFARADNPARNLTATSLEGKNVIVTHNYEYGDAFDLNKNIPRLTGANDLSVFRMLAAGRGEYALAYEKVANLLIKEHAKEFSGKIIAVGVIEEMQLYTVFSKTFPNSRHYLALFESGLELIRKNGRLREIEKQWE